MHSTLVSVASVLFLSLKPVHASDLLTGLKLVNDSLAGYIDEGCYFEASSGRALAGLAYYNDSMTVEVCAAACSDFLWFGVEYGRECYCGDSLGEGSVPAPSTDCTFVCGGNAEEKCGAGGRLNMYTKTSNPDAPAPPIAAPTDYAWEGCYSEATSTRALTGKSVSDDLMTVELCAASCSGYTYFGLEYYRECYCGNTLEKGSVSSPKANCNLSCVGNSTEMCGGNSFLSLYQFGGTSPPPVISTYNYESCFTEAFTGHALSGLAYYNDSMTVEVCSGACLGYSYFGLEYGRECYCGNSFNNGSIPTDGSGCDMVCPGDSTETCGGRSRLNVYQYGLPQSSTTTSSTIFATATSSISVSASKSSSITFTSSSISRGCKLSSTSSTSFTPPSASATKSSSTISATLSSNTASSTSSSISRGCKLNSTSSSSFTPPGVPATTSLPLSSSSIPVSVNSTSSISSSSSISKGCKLHSSSSTNFTPPGVSATLTNTGSSSSSFPVTSSSAASPSVSSLSASSASSSVSKGCKLKVASSSTFPPPSTFATSTSTSSTVSTLARR